MFTVVVTRLDGGAAELTPQQQSLKFTTAAVGGFGSCSFNLLGDRRRDVPKLAMVRIYLGTQLAWEGRIEDHSIQPADDPVTTSVTAYGLQRRLTDISVRRIWSKRDLPLTPVTPAVTAAPSVLLVYAPSLLVSTGQYLLTDPTKFGVQIAGGGVAIPFKGANGAIMVLPEGLTVSSLLCDLVLSGPNTGAAAMEAFVAAFDSSGAYLNAAIYSASQSVSWTPGGAGAKLFFGFFSAAGGGNTPVNTDLAQFSNIRILGTALQEDAAGGFYGGTILNDLLAFIPGLTIGVIEAGSDYTIPSIERAIRDTSLSVVNEVAGYYNREWAVWENGAFSWTTPNLDEPQWIIPLEQMLPGTRLETSIDTLASQVYVLFGEALDGNTAEQAAAAADARNPLVKASVAKDSLVQAPAVMTDNTAAQLAALEAAQQVYPPVTGTIVLNATSVIQNAVGAAKPAVLIRAGTNVYLPGMPKTDSIFVAPGRDGETLFHIVTTDVDMEAGTVTLELEGQAREIDVITARLAASTRVVTG